MGKAGLFCRRKSMPGRLSWELRYVNFTSIKWKSGAFGTAQRVTLDQTATSGRRIRILMRTKGKSQSEKKPHCSRLDYIGDRNNDFVSAQHPNQSYHGNKLCVRTLLYAS